MTKLSIGLIATAVALSLSACDRAADKAARDGVNSPPRIAERIAHRAHRHFKGPFFAYRDAIARLGAASTALQFARAPVFCRIVPFAASDSAQSAPRYEHKPNSPIGSG